jgi:hypothetical protein
LGIIGRRIEQFDPHAFSKLPELQGHKLGSLISCDCLRDSKPINDVFLDKLNHVLRCYLLQWNCLNPFGEVICC